jgi:hypothetical protein
MLNICFRCTEEFEGASLHSKFCSKCKKLQRYDANKRWRDKTNYDKKYYQENKEHCIEQSKKWYEKSEENKRKHGDAVKKWREKNKEKLDKWFDEHKKDKRLYDVKRNHGLSAEEFHKLIDDAGEFCPICGTKFEGVGAKMTAPHIDHDHKNGKIRGIICSSCNLALGKFKDDPEIVEKAAAWLRRMA